MIDLACSLFLIGLLLLAGVAYTVRVLARGRARDHRLAKEGSFLLAQSIMEMAYWALDPLVRALLALRVTPNMITGASLVPALLAATAMSAGHFGVGALLATAAAFCDMLDGIVARRLGVSSDAGEVFDASVDRYVEFLLLAGLAIYFRGSVVLEVLVLGAISGSFMVSYATAKAEAFHIDPPRGSMRRAERAVYLLLGAVLVPLLAPVLMELSGSERLKDLPLVLAIGFIALVGNASAIRRLRVTAQLVGARGIPTISRVGGPETDEHAAPATPEPEQAVVGSGVLSAYSRN